MVITLREIIELSRNDSFKLIRKGGRSLDWQNVNLSDPETATLAYHLAVADFYCRAHTSARGWLTRLLAQHGLSKSLTYRAIRILARIEQEEHSLDKSRALCAELQEIPLDDEDTDALFEGLQTQVWQLILENKAAFATRYGSEMIRLFESGKLTNHDKSAILLNRTLAKIEEGRGQLGEADHILRNAHSTFMNSEGADSLAFADLLIDLANAETHRGNHAAAVTLLRSSLRLYNSKIGFVRGYGRLLLLDLGWHLTLLGEDLEAVNCYRTIIRLERRIGRSEVSPAAEQKLRESHLGFSGEKGAFF